jgi:hypothetical protein
MKGCDANGQMASPDVPISESNWKMRRRVPPKLRS